LNYLGAVTGAAGILSVVLTMPALTVVYAFGLIIWFVWLGIVLLRTSPVSAAYKTATQQQAF
jgi:nicotinamide riboside transporter PnuC